MTLYLDSSAIIYAMEEHGPHRDRVFYLLSHYQGRNDAILTSRLAAMECRIRPLRDGDDDLLKAYDSLFSGMYLRIHEITPSIVERATLLRTKLRFAVPDAIHLATAIEAGADLVLTGDADWSRCPEVQVEVIRR